MSFCLFVVFDEAVPIKAIGFEKAHVYTPDQAHDPFLNDGAPPPLVVQMYFRSLEELEKADYAAIGGSGTCQAMAVRRFVNRPVRVPYCTYLVSYEGPAEDAGAWHAHYLANHPPLMAKLPGLRELEVYTPLMSVARTPWRKVDYLQRNKVAFDDAAALNAALASPVRHEMRADYAQLPRFSGAVKHYPMQTRLLLS